MSYAFDCRSPPEGVPMTVDRSGVTFQPEIGGFYSRNGFSGHGVQHAPTAGRAVAEHIVHGAYPSLDLSRLGFARILEDRPLAEAHVL